MKVSELNTNIVVQLEAALAQKVPLFPKSFIRVLAKVLAGVFVILYKYAEWSTLQYFPATAAIEDTVILGKTISPLKELGRLIGAGDPYAAVPAEMSMTLTVLYSPPFSETLPAGSELVDPNTSLTYTTLVAVALDAPTKTVTVRCTTGGTQGALAFGSSLVFSNPPATLYPTATVASVTVQGADAETEAAYRQRVISYYQRRPQGGSYADYYLWGMEASGIANIYPYRGATPGNVDIYVQSATLPDGIPDTAQLNAVAAQIDAADRKPVSATTMVYPIARILFTVDVAGLNVEDTVGAEADIITAVQDYFLSLAPYIDGITVGPRTDRVTAAAVSSVVQSVVAPYAGAFGTCRISMGAGYIDAYSLQEGELAKCTAVSFV